jgi:hypothetical protein
MGSMAYIDDRPQFVIKAIPAEKTDFALYYGTFYIDMETMAFTRAELQLDLSDKAAATRLILVKKPRGLRFTPKQVSLVMNYTCKDGKTVSRISAPTSTSTATGKSASSRRPIR